jgi:hypothetical protein
MGKRSFIYTLTFIVFFVVLAGCLKEEEYPIVPEIKFEDFILLLNTQTGIIERGVLRISFKDGDGDIGLNQNDTAPPYDFNLIIDYFEIQNRDTVRVYQVDPVSGDTSTFNARIPILTPKGSDKSIKGEIEDTLFIYDPTSAFDTILFKVYLVDRALHKSNVISTPLIRRKL